MLYFARALAWEATPKGVHVNAIMPGPIVADLTATGWRRKIIRRSSTRCHSTASGRPRGIAATALPLAGLMADFAVGATLSPNGGDVIC